MKKNIIQSATEPDKNSLWLSPQGLKKFSKKGWELIGGSNTPSDPSSGGSNDYILPFTFIGSNISSKDFDEIKEAINSGKTIRYKKKNNNYITITHSIIKEDTISLFIGDFDENTLIIYIASGIIAAGCYIIKYNINQFNAQVVHNIRIYDNNGEGISVQQTGIVNDYQPINGYSLGIFNSFGGECIVDDGIYNIWYENKREKRVIGQCIIYTTSNENGHKIITLIRKEVPDNDLVPGFVYGGEYYINSSNESTELTDFNIYYSNDINLLNSIKNANKEISNTYINNKITKFIFRCYNNKSTCVYKYNTLDQLYNELYFIDKINNILIIDYSDINESLPNKYPDITNKLLYITGLWDYTPDNGSLTKRFIPAIYTYNGAGSFTINYKVDISGPYEKRQIVGMIYYNGADKINHTYHTVCPSYTINLNVQDGTNTGTFDNNNINIYREVRQTIYGGGQIVIKGDATTNYVEAEAVATDYIVLRWSVPRIEEDGTSVTLSVYELKLTPEDYTTKVVNKTI